MTCVNPSQLHFQLLIGVIRMKISVDWPRISLVRNTRLLREDGISALHELSEKNAMSVRLLSAMISTKDSVAI